MLEVHPRFITDTDGKKVSVILSMEEFEALLEELDDIEDVKLFDAALHDVEDEYMTVTEYLKAGNSRNG